MSKSQKKSRYPKRIVCFADFGSDFVAEVKGDKRIGGSYVFIHKNPVWKFFAFILYRLVATPVAFIYTKLFLRERYIGKKKLKGHDSYILYCLHNEKIGDAFSPSMISFPKPAYVVIHPANVMLPVIGKVLPMLGGIPTPSDLRGARNFSLAIEHRLKGKAAITVYPEAHVWPKCAMVRPFTDSAFDIAVRNSAPAFAVTRTYKRKRIFGYSCRTYIDGPFYADKTLGRTDAARALGAELHGVMEKRLSEHNEVEVIRYLKQLKHGE